MRKLQIGIIGSSSSLQYSKKAEADAERIGELVARGGAVLIFGAEKDMDSLSTAACRGAKKYDGFTIGITYGREKEIFQKDGVDVVIACGLERGGGREFVFISSCDVVISIGGGSGTLTEMAMAYQANIPTIALKGHGGWSDKLGGTFLDERKKRIVVEAKNPEEAVKLAFEEGRKNLSIR